MHYHLKFTILFGDIARVTQIFLEMLNDNFGKSTLPMKMDLFSKNARVTSAFLGWFEKTGAERELVSKEIWPFWGRGCTRGASALVKEADARPRETRDTDRSAGYFWGISGIRVNIWPRHGAGHHRDARRESGRVPNLPQRSEGISQFLLSRRMCPATWGGRVT